MILSLLTEPIPAILPMAATAAVVAGAGLRERRRRARLNRGLHELRRPLQQLALSPAAPEPSSLQLALAAVGDLDAEVNGAEPAQRIRAVDCHAVVAAAIERWRGPAARAGRSLELRWAGGSAMVMADPTRLGQALDNLIANAIDHGGLRVAVSVSLCARGARIAVADGGAGGDPDRATPRRRRRAPDARAGHGLAVVRGVAAAHGGRFLLRHDAGGGTLAQLELPLAPAALPAAASAQRAAGAAPAELNGRRSPVTAA
jgi:signal transduction histidine kinase